MTVTVYRSTDSGAPAMSGVAGTLGNVLYTCLVTGYGSKPGAGWTRPFTNGTNTIALKQPAGSNGRYLYVNENSASVCAFLRGYENMTALGVGTGLFPTLTQNTSQVGWVLQFRSSYGIGNTTPVSWILITNGPLFYLWVNTSSNTVIDTNASGCQAMCFGDFISVVPGDTYNTILIGQPAIGSTTASYFAYQYADSGTLLDGHYIPRAYTQAGPSQQLTKSADSAFVGVSGHAGVSGLLFPNPADNKIYVSRYRLIERATGSRIYRGYLPGLWCPGFQATTNINDGDQILNIEGLPGVVLENHFCYGPQSALFETSDTW